MNNSIDNGNWTEVIEPKGNLLDLKVKNLWQYRDLIILLVKRDFVAVYKQTILGPLWHFIQPLMTTITFTIVFTRIAKIPTDGLPPILFYMCGIVCWNYFSGCLTKTSSTFVSNAGIFGKVYFPRLVMPIASVLSSGMGFLIQLTFFIGIYLYYLFSGTIAGPNWTLLLFPYLLLIMALLGLGVGIIVSSMTTKYRDLNFLVGFGVQLLMYATPVIYPLSTLPEKWKWLLLLNPMTSIIETIRYGFFGTGSFEYLYLAIGTGITAVILLIGIIIFNVVERTFMDTV